MFSLQRSWSFLFYFGFGLLVFFVLLFAHDVWAQNINQYSDLISDSGPSEQSNHTLSFKLNTSLSPSSVIEVTPPDGFTIMATSTFAERNVELKVNGVARPSASTPSAGVDGVEITTGSPGLVRYILAPDFSVAAGSQLELKIGNHTTNSLHPVTTYSTSTGTTTSQGDIEPIINTSVLGRHDVQVEIYDGGLVASRDFVIFLNEKINLPGIDTRETVPPYRFNPAPTSTVGGTTLNVEISLETDEFAVCKYDLEAGTEYGSMPFTFANTGLIFHSNVVAVTPNSTHTFYVRCIDDEGNFNIDDFIIAFSVNDTPTGETNTEGNVEGDGSGSGDSGSGSGSGDGGTTGESGGSGSENGGSAGSSGGGGGGGGGSGGDSGSTAGGGFESSDEAYQSGDGRVIISGYAFPSSKVSILVDGKFFDTTNSNALGIYSITLDEIARGVYTFGVYAEGPDKVRSSTFSTSFTVTGARTSSLGNINVAPSISADPDPADIGDEIVLSGYALPNSNITLQNGNVGGANSTFNTTADDKGFWSTTVDTSGLRAGTYQIRAKSEQTGGRSTNYSDYTFYGVGQNADLPATADFNSDGKVNLIDFSILLFWWNSNGGDSSPSTDLNSDGRVNLVDFSILLFNWTG